MMKRKSNKGFTLTETLIAIAILAVAVIPLLSNFILSARTNFKAKSSLNATNMAQDIMEGVSAYSATEVIELFDKVIADPAANSLIGSIVPNEFDSYTNAVKNGPDADGNYTFQINGLKKGSKLEYDLKFTMSPNKYVDSNNVLKNKTDNVNGADVANIAKMEKKTDSFCYIKSDDYASGIAKLTLNSTQKTQFQNEAIYKDYVKRTITVTLKNEGPDASNPKYRVYVKSQMEAAESKNADFGLDNTTRIVDTITEKNVSERGDQKPRALYLYYAGNKNSQSGKADAMDQIVVNNETGEPFIVYVIRTQNVYDAGERTNFTSYYCEITVNSKDPDGTANNKTLLVTNARQKLNNTPVWDDAKGEPTTPPEYVLDTTGCKVTYNGISTDDVSGFAVYQDQLIDNYEQESKNFVYTMLLEVRDKKQNDKLVATFDGSLQN